VYKLDAYHIDRRKFLNRFFDNLLTCACRCTFFPFAVAIRVPFHLTPHNAVLTRKTHPPRSSLTTTITTSLLISTHSIILVRIPLPLLHNLLTKPTTPRIELLAILIPHLPSTLAPSILPPLRKALIKIAPNDPLVQLCATDVLHAVQRVLVRVVLHEAEAAGSFVEAVQAHDQPLDAAAFAEELVDLLLGRVEGEVADVKRCGVLQLVHGVWGGGALGGVAALALVL